MEEQDIEKSIHNTAYREINYNRQVVNQLLYFSMLIVAAYFWLMLNIKDECYVGVKPAALIMGLSFCVGLIISAIGLSISKQLQQESVQWKIINEIEKEVKKDNLRYDTYNKYPQLYSKILLSIFCFLCFVCVTVFNWCLLYVYGWVFWSTFVSFFTYVTVMIYGFCFYNVGIRLNNNIKRDKNMGSSPSGKGPEKK